MSCNFTGVRLSNLMLSVCLSVSVLLGCGEEADPISSGGGGAGASSGGSSSSGAGGSAGGGGAPGTSGSTSDAGSGGSAAGSGGSAGSAGSAGGGGSAGSGNAGSGGADGGSAGLGGGGSGGAAGQGGGGAGGSGGQAPYNPCPTNGDPCKVMPLGDSITHLGGVQDSAYRLKLFELSLMNDKKLTFVGSSQNGPAMTSTGVPFPRQHEGHSGWTISDGGGRSGLYQKIEGWLKATPPHIVTLMIGTNDVDIQLDLANAPMRLGQLLDRIAQHAPNALTVVAQIVPTTDDNTNQRVRAYNMAIPALVKARQDQGKHVIMVDMYGALTANAQYKTQYFADKLHPNVNGLTVMANTWWEAIGELLPAK